MGLFSRVEFVELIDRATESDFVRTGVDESERCESSEPSAVLRFDHEMRDRLGPGR
jgi:hypothetical protein